MEILTGWATRAGPPADWPPRFRHHHLESTILPRAPRAALGTEVLLLARASCTIEALRSRLGLSSLSCGAMVVSTKATAAAGFGGARWRRLRQHMQHCTSSTMASGVMMVAQAPWTKLMI
eukprot:scaffold37605_cov62-Phaeocystis_antarctica.AAC.13